jgi:hypothetical protein
MTKAGRKQKRASKGNAETEEGIHKSVHLVTRLKSRLPRLEVFATMKAVLRARALIDLNYPNVAD